MLDDQLLQEVAATEGQDQLKERFLHDTHSSTGGSKVAWEGVEQLSAPVALEPSSPLFQLEHHPETFNFFQAVYLIEQGLGVPVVGENMPSGEQQLQFHTSAQLHFYGGQVQSFWLDQLGGYHLQVSGFSLLGHEGVLPLHYTAQANAKQGSNPSALLKFLDFFHHRSLTLFYQAWKKYQLMCQFHEPMSEVFWAKNSDRKQLNPSRPTPLMNQMLLSVLGLPERLGEREQTNLSESHDSQRPSEASLAPSKALKEQPWELALTHYAGLLARTSVGAQDLEQLLSDYFQLPITVAPFQGSWQALTESMQSCFASQTNPLGQNLQLGQTAVLGSKAWQMDAKISLVIECASRSEYVCFAPGSKALSCLKAMVSAILGDTVKVAVQLNMITSELLPMQLDRQKPPRLGFESKLGQPLLAEDANTTVSLSL